MLTPTELRRCHENVLRRSKGSWPDFEGLIRDIYTHTLRSGDIAIDGGAHFGIHTFQMAERVAPFGRVIAFEPSLPTVGVFKREWNKQRPEIRGVIELRETALGHVSGERDFHHVPDAPGLSSLMARPAAHSYRHEAMTIRVERLDDACGALDALRFMKLDLEGGEFHAFLGGRALIARTRPLIVFEMDQMSPHYFGYALEDLVDFFATLRYDVMDFFGNAYITRAHYESSLVWNLAAVPVEVGPAVVVEPVRRTLRTMAIRRALGRFRVLPTVYRGLRAASRSFRHR
jgi:FkbM family methyltransferase